MRRARIERLTIRAALIIGFGLVLGLWLFTGYAFSRRMESLELETREVTVRYMAAQDLLSAVRQQVSTNSIVLRNALLDPAASAQASYFARLEQGFASIDTALDAYSPVFASPDAAPAVERLRAEIGEFRRLTFAVMAAHEDGSGGSSPWDLLNRLITPRRATVIALSEEIRALNRKSLVQYQDATAGIYRGMQQQWWQRMGLALAATLGIALLAILYAGRLEDRLRLERDHVVQHRRDLQRLSARLVAAQEEERRALSRELHDEVGQVLGAIKVEVELAGRAIGADSDAHQPLSEIQSLTDNALSTVRDLSQLLRPAILDDLGLDAAIEWLVRGIERRNRLTIAFTQRGDAVRLCSEAETAAFRIVQEALTNVVRHAEATHSSVTLDYHPGRLVIKIEDDGRGFEPMASDERRERRGMGLIGIRERVAQRGGTVRVESAPGRGTTLHVELPTAPPAGTTDAVDAADSETPPALPSPRALHG